jgi:hypothetical protein
MKNRVVITSAGYIDGLYDTGRIIGIVYSLPLIAYTEKQAYRATFEREPMYKVAYIVHTTGKLESNMFMGKDLEAYKNFDKKLLAEGGL